MEDWNRISCLAQDRILMQRSMQRPSAVFICVDPAHTQAAA